MLCVGLFLSFKVLFEHEAYVPGTAKEITIKTPKTYLERRFVRFRLGEREDDIAMRKLGHSSPVI